MILPIYTYGNAVLRKKAQDITPDYPELQTLIANMFETMDASDGIGLAAPQIGLDIRVVVIDIDVLSEDYPEYKGSDTHTSTRTFIGVRREFGEEVDGRRAASRCPASTRM